VLDGEPAARRGHDPHALLDLLGAVVGAAQQRTQPRLQWPDLGTEQAKLGGRFVLDELRYDASRSNAPSLDEDVAVHRPGDAALAGVAELAEISGSDTFVHLSTPLGALVAQLVGVHYFELGAAVTMHFSPQDVYLFDAQGALLRAPVDVQRGAARGGA
jgi:ABC-type sugar transport system ATPase subunit